MSNADDAAAIDVYFRAHQNDPGAAPQYKAWREFYDGILFWWSDDDLANAKKRRDILNVAIGQPDLRSFSVPVEDRPPLVITTSGGTSSVDIFKGGGAPPTIRKGDRGAAVTKWQQIIGVTADGNFGSGTDTATRAWQAAHGITADGIVGPATWAKVGVQTVTDIAPPPPALVALGLGLGTPSSTGYPTIQLGSTGPDVVRWQNILGLTPADGVFGPATDAATKKWQTNHGIAPDGVVGPQTWKVATTTGATPSVPAGFQPPPVKTPTTTGAATPAKPALQEAGFMGFLGGLSTPAKAAVGLGVLASLAYGVKKKGGR